MSGWDLHTLANRLGKTAMWVDLGDCQATEELKCLQVLPRRWVVGRTFVWLRHYRRLSKDYEALPQTSDAMMCANNSHLMISRLLIVAQVT